MRFVSTHLSQCGNNQAECQSNLCDRRLVSISPAGGASDADWDQQECSEELGDQHTPNVSVIGDVLHAYDLLHSCNKHVLRYQLIELHSLWEIILSINFIGTCRNFSLLSFRQRHLTSICRHTQHNTIHRQPVHTNNHFLSLNWALSHACNQQQIFARSPSSILKKQQIMQQITRRVYCRQTIVVSVRHCVQVNWFFYYYCALDTTICCQSIFVLHPRDNN